MFDKVDQVKVWPQTVEEVRNCSLDGWLCSAKPSAKECRGSMRSCIGHPSLDWQDWNNFYIFSSLIRNILVTLQRRVHPGFLFVFLQVVLTCDLPHLLFTLPNRTNLGNITLIHNISAGTQLFDPHGLLRFAKAKHSSQCYLGILYQHSIVSHEWPLSASVREDTASLHFTRPSSTTCPVLYLQIKRLLLLSCRRGQLQG